MILIIIITIIIIISDCSMGSSLYEDHCLAINSFSSSPPQYCSVLDKEYMQADEYEKVHE